MMMLSFGGRRVFNFSVYCVITWHLVLEKTRYMSESFVSWVTLRGCSCDKWIKSIEVTTGAVPLSYMELHLNECEQYITVSASNKP